MRTSWRRGKQAAHYAQKLMCCHLALTNLFFGYRVATYANSVQNALYVNVRIVGGNVVKIILEAGISSLDFSQGIKESG